MDETRKAASVGQLKELHDAVMPRIDALEAGSKGETDSAATIAALSSQLVVLQQGVQELRKAFEADAAREPEKVDLTPILTVLAEQGAQLAQLMAIVMRPVTKTGEATLPDGGKVILQVSETRN